MSIERWVWSLISDPILPPSLKSLTVSVDVKGHERERERERENSNSKVNGFLFQ